MSALGEGSELGYFQRKLNQPLMVFNMDIMDDLDAYPQPKKREPSHYAKYLFEQSGKVKKIVSEARLILGERWVSIPAEWWRKYAQAVQFKEEFSLDMDRVHTLPGGFQELQPGYFMDSENDRMMMLSDLKEPEALPWPLREDDAIHVYVNIPLEAYLLLCRVDEGEKTEERIKELEDEKCIHTVVVVSGQRGVKGPREQPMRAIVDTERVTFRFICLTKKKDDELDEEVTFPSNITVGKAFLDWFNRHEDWFKDHGVMSEDDFKGLAFKQDIVYKDFEEEKKDDEKDDEKDVFWSKNAKCLVYTYTFDHDGEDLLWNTHMAVSEKVRAEVIDETNGKTRTADESLVKVVL